MICRPDRKSQARKCLGFCTADFWSSYESAEQKTQILPNLRLPITSDDMLACHITRPRAFLDGRGGRRRGCQRRRQDRVRRRGGRRRQLRHLRRPGAGTQPNGVVRGPHLAQEAARLRGQGGSSIETKLA